MVNRALEATSENILNTYLTDSIGGNENVVYFVEHLNSFKQSTSISVEGQWGSGKTFFVKQAKLILDCLNETNDNIDIVDIGIRKAVIDKFEKSQHLTSNLDLKPQATVYYDAWANDNDEDPLLSLIYEIAISLNDKRKFIDSTSVKDKLCGIANFVTGRDAKVMLDGFEGDDFFAQLKKSRNLQEQIDEFLESCIFEHGDRLVIFVDELDRCKPSFAVQLLERIKHYFGHEKITFVFSVNVSELQYTIKKFYGADFNGTRYLDKFF